MTFPELETPTWTARFDSYDQRTESLYFVLTAAGVAAPFMVELSTWGVPDPSDPAFLREQLAELAATGRTNTDYTGYSGHPGRAVNPD